jgi:hypothetical protein
MKYDQRRFTVNMGESDEYRDNWERIFGKRSPASTATPPSAETKDETPPPAEPAEPATR